jgi:hypothetical protein
MASKTHADVEYMVERGIDRGHGKRATDPRYFDDPTEALAAAAMTAMSTGESTLSVLISSEEGAHFHGGDDAVERYREDLTRASLSSSSSRSTRWA